MQTTEPSGMDMNIRFDPAIMPSKTGHHFISFSFSPAPAAIVERLAIADSYGGLLVRLWSFHHPIGIAGLVVLEGIVLPGLPDRISVVSISSPSASTRSDSVDWTGEEPAAKLKSPIIDKNSIVTLPKLIEFSFLEVALTRFTF